MRQYLDNPARADLTYTNKRVRVTGWVRDIGVTRKDAFIRATTYYVLLDADVNGRDRSPPYVSCTFPEQRAGEVAPLKRGQDVAFDCLCHGTRLDATTEILMDDCEFAPGGGQRRD
jgi:hypothetical protein